MDLRDTPEEAAVPQPSCGCGSRPTSPTSVRRGPLRGTRPRLEPQAARSRLRRPDLAQGVRRCLRARTATRRSSSRRWRAPRRPRISASSASAWPGRRSSPHGTDAQKQKHLEKILSTEDIWCQGFSEPGRRLRSLRRSARAPATRTGTSSSTARRSGRRSRSSPRCILATRSDPDSERHARPDVSARRHACARASTFGRYARSPARRSSTRSSSPTSRYPWRTRVGDIGAGWQVAMTTLLHERGTLGFALVARPSRAQTPEVDHPREERRVRPRGAARPRSRASGSGFRPCATPTTAR